MFAMGLILLQGSGSAAEKVWGSSLCLGTWALAAGLGLTPKQPNGKEARPGLGGLMQNCAGARPCTC